MAQYFLENKLYQIYDWWSPGICCSACALVFFIARTPDRFSSGVTRPPPPRPRPNQQQPACLPGRRAPRRRPRCADPSWLRLWWRSIDRCSGRRMATTSVSSRERRCGAASAARHTRRLGSSPAGGGGTACVHTRRRLLTPCAPIACTQTRTHRSPPPPLTRRSRRPLAVASAPPRRRTPLPRPPPPPPRPRRPRPRRRPRRPRRAAASWQQATRCRRLSSRPTVRSHAAPRVLYVTYNTRGDGRGTSLCSVASHIMHQHLSRHLSFLPQYIQCTEGVVVKSSDLVADGGIVIFAYPR